MMTGPAQDRNEMELPMTDQATARGAFPALASGLVFLENAGGSQVPATVVDRMHRYLAETYVQLGAGYPLSRRCTRTVADAHALAARLVNADDDAGLTILGPSTTALLNLLAACWAQLIAPGQEIVLAESGHEANLGPWKRLEDRGARLRWWRLDPETGSCPLDALDTLLTDRTALVALPHVSNLVGGIADVAAVCRAAHAVGARVVADGVAYAPHRAIDVTAWDVDVYAFSLYKVYGPHMAVLYGKRELLDSLPGPNHFFVGRDECAYRFEPGGPSHEACAGLLGIGDYLKLLAGETGEAACDRPVIETAFRRMAEWEQPPLERLLSYLGDRPRVRVIGSGQAEPDRVGTVSFVHATRPSREITAAVDQTEVAIRHGHMYAYHLCEALGLDPADGVVRVSLVHYNTVAEIERLIEILDPLL